jgi:hypothetical protein
MCPGFFLDETYRPAPPTQLWHGIHHDSFTRVAHDVLTWDNMQATGFQHGGGVTMVVDYSGPDTGGRKMRCPSVEAVTPQAIKASEWTLQVFGASYNLYVS